MVSESHIYLTRCRSCCRRSSLCCAERSSRLWVPASQDEGGKQETLRRRRERDRKNCAVTFGWTVVTLVTFRQRKNTASDYTCLGRPTHALLYIGLARAETCVPRPNFRGAAGEKYVLFFRPPL